MSGKPEECNVCLEAFNKGGKKPRILPCGHTFCSPCLKGLITEDSLACPHCRSTHSASNVEAFPVVFILLDILKNSSGNQEKAEKSTPAQAFRKALSKKSSSEKNMKEKDFQILTNSFEDMLSQLQSYKNTLCAWEDHHEKLKNALQEIIENNEKAQLVLGEEGKAVQELQQEGVQQQEQLKLTAESLSAAATMHELLVVTDDLDACRATVKDWIQRCQDFFPDVAVLRRSIKVRAAIENYLESVNEARDTDEVAQNGAFLGTYLNNDAADEIAKSVLSIPQRVDLIMKNTSLRLTVESLRQRKGPVKALLEEGKVFAVQEFEGRLRSAKISLRQNELFLQHFKDVPPPRDSYTIPHEELSTSLDLARTLAYLELVWRDSPPKRVTVRLFPDYWLAKQFLLVCTGEKGPSYVNTELSTSGNDAFVFGGEYGENGQPAIIEKDGNGGFSAPRRLGSVMMHPDDRSDYDTSFKIPLRSSKSDVDNNIFGHVETGLEVLMSALRARYKEIEVAIVDCGAVLSI